MSKSFFPIFLICAGIVSAQPSEVRIDNERVVPGGLVQLKVGLDNSRPTSISGVMDAAFFGEVEGIALHGAAGDVAGAAVVNGNNIVTRFTSSKNIFRGVDNPMMTIAVRVKQGITNPVDVRFTGDNSASRSGRITPDGSIYVNHVGSSGNVVRITGGGFEANTQISIGDGFLATQFLGCTFPESAPCAIDVTLPAGANINRGITLRNPSDRSEVTYYSQYRGARLGSSTRELLNLTTPIFASGDSPTRGFLYAAPTEGFDFVAIALQNENEGVVDATLTLRSAKGAVLGEATMKIPSGNFVVRDIAEIFGITPTEGSAVTITSTSPVRMLGLVGEEPNRTVAPLAIGPGPTITASPTTLSFTVSSGALSTSQRVTVTTNPAGSSYTVSTGTSTGDNWIITNPTGVTDAGFVDVAVSPGTLTPGTYTGSLYLVLSGTNPVVIPVTMTVSTASISASPSFLSFSHAAGSFNPSTQSVFLSGPTGATFTVSAAPQVFWLGVTPNTNTLPATVQVTVSPAGLAAGFYSSTIIVTSPSSAPIQIPLSLVVTGQGGGSQSTILSPTTGTILGSTATFSWLNTGAQKYRLDVSRTQGGADVFSQETFGTALSVFNIPQDVAVVYVQLSTFINNFYLAPVTYSYATTNSNPGSGTSLRFVPVTPCRVADTRASSGFGGQFGPPSINGGTSRNFGITAGACGIPGDAQAYSLNVTVVPLAPLSFLTMWPAGQNQPTVSTLNAGDGAVTSNAAIVPAGAGGAISVYATDATNVILDINGYFTSNVTSNSLQLYPVTPCRVVDTRLGIGLLGGPTMTAGQTREFPVPQSGCVPGGAQAYSLNYTVVPPGPLQFLTTYPTGQAQPNVSTLNSFDGAIKANAALVPAGTNGSINTFVTDRTDVVIDANAYFALPAAGGLSFYPLTPCRVADTRNSFVLGSGATRDFAVVGVCGVPSTARAYSMNVTVVPAGALGFLTTWPTGAVRPLVSTLNSGAGKTLANAAIIPAGTGGAISVFVTDPTHVVLDINGYFAP